jgi:hypothetical protein
LVWSGQRHPTREYLSLIQCVRIALLERFAHLRHRGCCTLRTLRCILHVPNCAMAEERHPTSRLSRWVPEDALCDCPRQARMIRSHCRHGIRPVVLRTICRKTSDRRIIHAQAEVSKFAARSPSIDQSQMDGSCLQPWNTPNTTLFMRTRHSLVMTRTFTMSVRHSSR